MIEGGRKRPFLPLFYKMGGGRGGGGGEKRGKGTWGLVMTREGKREMDHMGASPTLLS